MIVKVDLTKVVRETEDNCKELIEKINSVSKPCIIYLEEMEKTIIERNENLNGKSEEEMDERCIFESESFCHNCGDCEKVREQLEVLFDDIYDDVLVPLKSLIEKLY